MRTIYSTLLIITFFDFLLMFFWSVFSDKRRILLLIYPLVTIIIFALIKEALPILSFLGISHNLYYPFVFSLFLISFIIMYLSYKTKHWENIRHNFTKSLSSSINKMDKMKISLVLIENEKIIFNSDGDTFTINYPVNDKSIQDFVNTMKQVSLEKPKDGADFMQKLKNKLGNL